MKMSRRNKGSVEDMIHAFQNKLDELEGSDIHSSQEIHTSSDTDICFDSVEGYLKYNIQEGYIDWMSIPSEDEDDDFEGGESEDFYDTVWGIENAISEVSNGSNYKIYLPTQFEEELGAFCAVVVNGKRYIVEGQGNMWAITEINEDGYISDDIDECDHSGSDIHSSKNILSSKDCYIDDSGIMGVPGAKYTKKELLDYYRSNKNYDPVLLEYSSADEWLRDTLAFMRPCSHDEYDIVTI